MKRKPIILLLLFFVAGAATAAFTVLQPRQTLELTGTVTADEIRVGAQLQGRVQELLVHEGDQVAKGQLLAILAPDEYLADTAYYEKSAGESEAQVAELQAELTFIENQSREQVRQAEAALARDKDQVTQAKADLEYSRLNYQRLKSLHASHTISQQDFDQARTAYNAADARVAALEKAVQAGEAALSLAKVGSDQVIARRAALTAGEKHQAAATARADKAKVVLGYTRITAPQQGIIDIIAVRNGEVAAPGQTLLTLVDPDNLWVRADIEESYIDRVRLGDTLTVRLPSGTERPGTVIYRGVDADYATQRDVSRSKRDIKTFQIRLRCDNSDRRLALGMTASLFFPLVPRP